MNKRKGFMQDKMISKSDRAVKGVSTLENQVADMVKILQQQGFWLEILLDNATATTEVGREQLIMNEPDAWMFMAKDLWYNAKEKKFYKITSYMSEFVIAGEAPNFVATNSIEGSEFDIKADSVEEARKSLLEVIKEKFSKKAD